MRDRVALAFAIGVVVGIILAFVAMILVWNLINPGVEPLIRPSPGIENAKGGIVWSSQASSPSSSLYH